MQPPFQSEWWTEVVMRGCNPPPPSFQKKKILDPPMVVAHSFKQLYMEDAYAVSLVSFRMKRMNTLPPPPLPRLTHCPTAPITTCTYRYQLMNLRLITSTLFPRLIYYERICVCHQLKIVKCDLYIENREIECQMCTKCKFKLLKYRFSIQRLSVV